jgi:hypothetical protein
MVLIMGLHWNRLDVGFTGKILFNIFTNIRFRKRQRILDWVSFFKGSPAMWGKALACTEFWVNNESEFFPSVFQQIKKTTLTCLLVAPCNHQVVWTLLLLSDGSSSVRNETLLFNSLFTSSQVGAAPVQYNGTSFVGAIPTTIFLNVDRMFIKDLVAAETRRAGSDTKWCITWRRKDTLTSPTANRSFTTLRCAQRPLTSHFVFL